MGKESLYIRTLCATTAYMRDRHPKTSQWIADKLHAACEWYVSLTPDSEWDRRLDAWTVQQELAHRKRPVVHFFNGLDDLADGFDVRLISDLRTAMKETTHVLTIENDV